MASCLQANAVAAVAAGCLRTSCSCELGGVLFGNGKPCS
jgi:hypothetical protein